MVAPGGLCLDRIRDDLPDRRSTYAAAATLWLSWLLARMDDEMVEDKASRCEERIDPEWHDDELLLAAHFYHDYLAERIPGDGRRRYRIHAMLDSIETRLDITRIIDSGAPKSKIVDTLSATRLGREHRYKRNLDDVTRLGGRLRNENSAGCSVPPTEAAYTGCPPTRRRRASRRKAPLRRRWTWRRVTLTPRPALTPSTLACRAHAHDRRAGEGPAMRIRLSARTVDGVENDLEFRA